jgi:PAS domain S-box-containing protein
MAQENARPQAPAQDAERAEQAEQIAIIQSSRDSIMGVTSGGVISSCNPAGAQLYGRTAGEIIGKPADILIPPERRSHEAAILQRVLAGDMVHGYLTRRLRHDGTTVAVSVTISPLVDRAGAVRGTATIARPITEAESPDRPADSSGGHHDEMPDAVEPGQSQNAERPNSPSDSERLEAQLQQSQRLEVLGQLAGGVAHDFNNLLAVILNYAAFVDDELAAGADADFGAASRDVKQIQRAAERATALTHQLLAFARREVVQPRVLNLNNVVTDVQQLLDRTIGEDVLLLTELAADLWPVMADPGQIEQILVNLAVNARDAMPGGGALTIDTANIIVDPDFIATGSAVKPGRHIRLRVGDTGTGMPADVIAHIFEPFYTTKPDGTGTGLGLSTVYGIVAQADATIDIHSQPDVGTTFTILIPVTDELAVVVADEPSYQRAPKGETVLIVEDEEALREVTERIFTSNGYRVITAANGADAVAIAARHDGDIHLLITDVVMPNMLGKEAAEKIRQLKPDIEVLYMSGYAQPVLASQGRLDPDVNLIEKPFSASSIIEKAGRVLNGHFRGFETVEPLDAPAAASQTSPDAAG